MSCLRLYATAVVLLTWAVTWALGVRGDAAIGAWLFVTAVSVTVAERERSRRRRARRA